MKILDNTTELLGEQLKNQLTKGSRLKIAASCFSIYAYEALKSDLLNVDQVQFIFTTPTFVPSDVTDKIRRERRQFFIPKGGVENSVYGTEFEIQLRNRLNQRAIARECAEWIRKKATFKSNTTKAEMQQFIHAGTDNAATSYMPISGFTAPDLGYQQGNTVSNFVTEFDEPAHTNVYLQLFNEIWSDAEKVRDVTSSICDYIESVYQENSPERIYFLMLYNIFRDFLMKLMRTCCLMT